ncbi:MAG TPA: DUF1015 domain-containing protein [Dissulfurispiraceae bacterium]|nr:DUF1015 domain-containing protein [Dissulfurispiraceae bacterium]
MPKVIPFNGVVYNCSKVSGSEVIAPPYDVISPECRETLYGKSPYNIVRIDFGKNRNDDDASSNKYSRARVLLDEWLREGILMQDDKPAFYAYTVDYAVLGQKKTLKGIFGLVKIEELGDGIYPHEMTRSKPKADRLDLMRHCMANTSPIYTMYNSRNRITTKILDAINDSPYIVAEDSDGAVHKLFRILEPAETELISKELSNTALYIADGHHRYEVALEFKKEMDMKTGRIDDKPRPWDYVLMFLANMSEEGITILPTHRMVKGIADKSEAFEKLKEDFDISQLPAGTDISKSVSSAGKHTLGLYLKSDGKWYLLRYRGGKLKDLHSAINTLDVVLLHELILKRDFGITDVAYEMDIDEAMKRVEAGDFDAVFLLNPTGVDDIERVAAANLRMPPKSTYFYPKLLTGMVINKF